MTMRESLVRLLELKLDQNLLKPLQSAKSGIDTEDLDGNSDGGDDSNDEMGVPSNIEARSEAFGSKLRNTRNSMQPSLIKDEQLKQSIGDACDQFTVTDIACGLGMFREEKTMSRVI